MDAVCGDSGTYKLSQHLQNSQTGNILCTYQRKIAQWPSHLLSLLLYYCSQKLTLVGCELKIIFHPNMYETIHGAETFRCQDVNYRSIDSPCPSCPFVPLPQENTFCLSVTASVCLHPHVIWTTFCKSKMLTIGHQKIISDKDSKEENLHRTVYQYHGLS